MSTQIKKTIQIVVLLIVVQIVYISMELLEAKTEERAFGIVSGFSMIILGLLIVSIALHKYNHEKRWYTDTVFEILAGAVYISLGSAVTEARWNRNSLKRVSS
jgi:hypothetical protein